MDASPRRLLCGHVEAQRGNLGPGFRIPGQRAQVALVTPGPGQQGHGRTGPSQQLLRHCIHSLDGQCNTSMAPDALGVPRGKHACIIVTLRSDKNAAVDPRNSAKLGLPHKHGVPQLPRCASIWGLAEVARPPRPQKPSVMLIIHSL